MKKEKQREDVRTQSLYIEAIILHTSIASMRVMISYYSNAEIQASNICACYDDILYNYTYCVDKEYFKVLDLHSHTAGPTINKTTH